MSFLCGPLYVIPLGLPFAEAVRDPTVAVEDYSETTWRGERVKQLRLAFGFQLAAGQTVRARNDYFFSADSGWLCVGMRERTQAKLDDAVYLETVYTFGADRTQTAFIPQMVERTSYGDKKGAGRRERLMEITRVTPRQVRTEEVRLSGFGLPEPQGVNWPQPTPSWLWFIAAGCVSGLLFIGLRYAHAARARRTKGAAP